MSDPRPLLHRTLDQMGGVVDAVTDLDAPSPCDGWDVRTLINHVVAVHHKLLRVTQGTALEVAHIVEVKDGDHGGELTRLRADIAEAWSDDALLDREMAVPWGRVPGRGVVVGFTQELVVHAWDIAVVENRTDDLDPQLAETLLGPIREIIPAEGREHIPFGEVVEVPDDADPYDRLVGWLGRDPGELRAARQNRTNHALAGRSSTAGVNIVG